MVMVEWLEGKKMRGWGWIACWYRVLAGVFTGKLGRDHGRVRPVVAITDVHQHFFIPSCKPPLTDHQLAKNTVERRHDQAMPLDAFGINNKSVK
jgi:hypothetical protein